MQHSAALCGIVLHWITGTTNFKTNRNHTGKIQSSDLQVSHLAQEFDRKNLGGGVHMPFEDIMLEFPTGKFVRSLSVFTSLSVHGKSTIYTILRQTSFITCSSFNFVRTVWRLKRLSTRNTLS